MVFTVKQFVEDCKAGYLIDDDGCGYYSNSDQDFAEDEKPAYPSDVECGFIDDTYQYVHWYNK